MTYSLIKSILLIWGKIKKKKKKLLSAPLKFNREKLIIFMEKFAYIFNAYLYNLCMSSCVHSGPKTSYIQTV